MGGIFQHGFKVLIRGGILGVRWGEILLISSYTLPALGRVGGKNVNKLADLNAAVSSPGPDSKGQKVAQKMNSKLRKTFEICPRLQNAFIKLPTIALASTSLTVPSVSRRMRAMTASSSTGWSAHVEYTMRPPTSSSSRPRRAMRYCRVFNSHISEVSGILELGNVWIFVQLTFSPHWPMNQLNKNPNIA